MSTVPLAGLPSGDTLTPTAVRSYWGPLSAHGTSICTGALNAVVTVVSSQVGRPSGAQSGLPSQPFDSSRSIGTGPVLPSARFITRSPGPAKSSTYATCVPSGDHVQL